MSGDTSTYISTSEGGLTPALVMAAGSVLPILGVTAVALRFLSRLRGKTSRLGADDWLILCSIFFTTGLGLMLIIGAAKDGLARPTELKPGRLSYLNTVTEPLLLTEKIFFAFNLTQTLAFGTAKLSVLFYYRRIFQRISGVIFNVSTISLITIVIVWAIGFFFARLFRCRTNFWASWAPLNDLLANCYSSTPMFQAFSISDVITDLLIIAVSLIWLHRLALPTSHKIALGGVFAVGFLAIAAGIARLAIFIQQTNNFEANQDGIGHLTTEMYWSMIEMGMSVIAACLPTIRFLYGGSTAETIIHKA